MQYTEYKIQIVENKAQVDPEVILDLYSASLAEVGFDSFEYAAEDSLLAYIPKELSEGNHAIDELFSSEVIEGVSVQVSSQVMPDVNWNEEWEKNYFQSIIIGDNLCQIRAPFHEANPSVRTEIIISPKMAFGTGNHETTALMMSYILDNDMTSLRVLDMGCGTGILGILALKQGAKELTAIDIDEWAYENVLENASLNNVHISDVHQGDATSLKEKEPYDLILANITRNILLEDMPAYVSVLKSGGSIIFSGFYEEDAELLISRGAELGLGYLSKAVRNRWTRLELVKN